MIKRLNIIGLKPEYDFYVGLSAIVSSQPFVASYYSFCSY